MNHTHPTLLLAALGLGLVAAQAPPSQPAPIAPKRWAMAGPIEDLAPPPPAAPPGGERPRQLEDDLRKKRQHRRQREREEEPPSTYGDILTANLLKDAQTPHRHSLMVELALVLPTPLTSADRQGYTSDITPHFNVAWRPAQGEAGGVKLWVGARLAPFAGSGFYKIHPGTYGLTYFGPMVGVGKFDLAPSEHGRTSAGPAGEGEEPMPSLNGWLISAGVAAVSKAGASEWPQDKGSDFASKGVAFDAPGAWLEARFLHVMYGALGVNMLGGVQLGKNKMFAYGGVAVAAWD